MKKTFAYILLVFLSLPFLIIVRSIAREQFQEHSFLFVGVAFGLVVYAFYLVKGSKPRKNSK